MRWTPEQPIVSLKDVHKAFDHVEVLKGVAALEKKDAEALALMRSTHEVDLLSSTRAIKQQQVREAQEMLASLLEARKLADQRKEYYESRSFMSAGEAAQQALMVASTFLQTAGSSLQLSAATAHSSPEYYVGALVGSPLASGAITLNKIPSGSSLGESLQAASGELQILSSLLQAEANMAGTMAGYQRRQDDWGFQAGQAETELDQIDKQILAAEIRLAIAERDLANHERQIEQTREVRDYLREKFTDAELYGWMSGQLSALHHQVHRMAYELAKRAERAAQLELGVEAEQFSFVKLTTEQAKGRDLLAGARLAHQLRQMDIAYLEKNQRELEITKHVSLAMLDPAELIRLRETGSCRISVPEVLFDLDFPGHYRRRIKAVSLTIPCVVGPYTSISATLRLLSSRWRKEPTPGYDSDLFIAEFGGADSIAVSTAQNDSGLFEMSFRDERFLPFEGAGAVSDWELELPPKAFAPFDYASISDVIIRLAYTARGGGTAYRDQVSAAIQNAIGTWLQALGGRPLTRLFSLRHDFPSAWHRLLHPEPGSVAIETGFTLGEQHFFYFWRKLLKDDRVQTIPEIILRPKDAVAYEAFRGVHVEFRSEEAMSNGTIRVDASGETAEWGGLPYAELSRAAAAPIKTWSISISIGEVNEFTRTIAREVDGQWSIIPDVLDDVLVSFITTSNGG